MNVLEQTIASRQLKLHYAIYRSLERILEEAHWPFV